MTTTNLVKTVNDMTKEDKDLLLKDLCARLRYDTVVYVSGEDVYLRGVDTFGDKIEVANYHNNIVSIEDVKPYLRPMSSRTKEEKSEMRQWGCLCMGTDDCVEDIGVYGAIHSVPVIDWLNAHHFDYRGLMEKGLAIEVTNENNPYK